MARSGDLVDGRYRLIELVGEGGMGAVWRASDVRLERDVAIKQLRLPPVADAAEQAALVRRMLREARTAAKLRHPGVVAVHDLADERGGLPWIVMDLVAGRSLDEVVGADGRLPAGRAASIGAQVADALAAAHAAGIVHRDIKPANILLETGDRALVTDFGIAIIDGATRITHTGMIVGTPAYMAPEQLAGQPATPASDLWSLGATLYYAIEGRHAFTGYSRDELTPMTHGEGMDGIISDLMNKNPSHRPTASDAATYLRNGPPRTTLIDTHKPSQRSPATITWENPTQIAALAVHDDDEEIVGLAFNPDETTLFVNSWDEIRLWDVAQRSEIKEDLTGYSSSITAVALSPDGETLAIADDGTFGVALFDFANSTISDALPIPYSVQAMAFGPDGRTLATVEDSSRPEVRVWDVAGRGSLGKPLTIGEVDAVAFSASGRSLAAGTIEEVQVWDIVGRRKSGEPFAVGEGALKQVALSPDGGTLAAAGGHNRVRVWDVAQRSMIGELFTVSEGIAAVSLAFSPDGRTLAIGRAKDDTVRLWDVARSAEIATLFVGERFDYPPALAFSPGGRILATTDGATVQLWGP